MFRKTIISALAATLIAASAAPAFAGPAENAFLATLANSWTGKGKLSGAQSGPITCRVVITGSNQRAAYQGRCTIPDMAQQAFAGTIVYNDATKHYESRSGAGTIVGVRNGNSLVFSGKDNTMAGAVASSMTISPTSLVVNFSIVSKKGEKTSARISFTR